ncbi:MAG: hypothetical protein Q9162_001185 [Coniocarpon cinnabarinum]
MNWPLPRRRHIAEPTDDLPSPEKLAEASEIPLYDADSNTIAFRDLLLGGNSIGERRLFLFIRHWHCWGCQQYVQYLIKNLNPEDALGNSASTGMPTKIILIGIGHPSLIKSYIQRTNSPYETYTEPTLRLLRLLGCHRWGGLIWRFGKRPEYSPKMNHLGMTYHSLSDKYRSVYTDTLLEESCSSDAASEKSFCSLQSKDSDRACDKKVPGFHSLHGPLFQVGGEFLFEDGQLVWCHRMKNMRSHADVKTLRKVLEIDAESESMESRLQSKWIRQKIEDLEAQGKRPSKELRREVEGLQVTAQELQTAAPAVGEPGVSDEEEDRYLERTLGRKPSMASVKGGLHMVTDPSSGRARLTRDVSGVGDEAHILAVN